MNKGNKRFRPEMETNQWPNTKWSLKTVSDILKLFSLHDGNVRATISNFVQRFKKRLFTIFKTR